MTKERSTGDWFQTFTGKAWWPMDPKPEDVDIKDIAHGLAYQCRFNGHCREFYSVAEHSVRISDELAAVPGRGAALAGLLHDAAEAYLGDIVRPLKRRLPTFCALERNNQEAIFAGLGVSIDPTTHAEAVAEMDLVLLATERRDLMTESPLSWVAVETVEPLALRIECWGPGYAEGVFLRRFEDLTAGVAPYDLCPGRTDA